MKGEKIKKSNTFGVKGFNAGIMIFMLIIILILASMLIENKNIGYEQGRYDGWLEACHDMNQLFGYNSFGEYACTNEYDPGNLTTFVEIGGVSDGS